MSDRISHPIVELTKSRVKEFLREPDVMFWVFAFPILLTLALGLAFRVREPAPVPVAVADGPGAPAIAEALRRDPGLTVQVLAGDALARASRGGDVHVVVVPGQPGQPPTYRFDPTRAESRLARLLVDESLQRAAGRTDVWQATEEKVVAPGSRYVDWVLPGLLGMNIMGTGMWSIAFSVVFARMRKLLKRLVATPMRRSHYLLSHVLARLIFLALEVFAILAFGAAVFGVPMRGSFAALAVVSLVGAMSFSGIGLLVASRPRTIEAVSGLMNVVMMPMWIVSGIFFSSANFPPMVQPIVQALPLTALNDALRAIMLEGASLAAVGGEVLIVAVWGVASFVAALKLFRWT